MNKDFGSMPSIGTMRQKKKDHSEHPTKGQTVTHADPLGPRGKGVVLSGDKYSVKVKWDSGKTGFYHPRILIKVKE
tara:strand:- start:10 stop:237 length:228 start_codon:yes stop_codon:yes gene_type:complete